MRSCGLSFAPGAAGSAAIPALARKVLVTMGGSDPDNVTLQVVRALQQVGIEGLEITVVLGASYPHALPHLVRDTRVHVHCGAVRTRYADPDGLGRRGGIGEWQHMLGAGVYGVASRCGGAGGESAASGASPAGCRYSAAPGMVARRGSRRARPRRCGRFSWRPSSALLWRTVVSNWWTDRA